MIDCNCLAQGHVTQCRSWDERTNHEATEATFQPDILKVVQLQALLALSTSTDSLKFHQLPKSSVGQLCFIPFRTNFIILKSLLSGRNVDWVLVSGGNRAQKSFGDDWMHLCLKQRTFRINDFSTCLSRVILVECALFNAQKSQQIISDRTKQIYNTRFR